MCVVSYIQGVSYKDHFNIRHTVLAIDINIVDFFFTGLFLPFTFFFPNEKLFVATKFIFYILISIHIKTILYQLRACLVKKFKWKKRRSGKKCNPHYVRNDIQYCKVVKYDWVNARVYKIMFWDITTAQKGQNILKS